MNVTDFLTLASIVMTFFFVIHVEGRVARLEERLSELEDISTGDGK